MKKLTSFNPSDYSSSRLDEIRQAMIDEIEKEHTNTFLTSFVIGVLIAIILFIAFGA